MMRSLFGLMLLVLLLVGCSSKRSRSRTSKSALLRSATKQLDQQKCNKRCGSGLKCQTKPCTCEICVPQSCADIHCPAGFSCVETPDGPDCVPDAPTCKGFYCRRGTNCYIRNGAPICLPNTCEVRVCRSGLTCIDTPNGALCRRGKKKLRCKRKYCPKNSRCEDHQTRGAICKKI